MGKEVKKEEILEEKSQNEELDHIDHDEFSEVFEGLESTKD